MTTADGPRLWFETIGSGPQVVVLPNGLPLRDDLRRLEDGRTLVFYDARNRGRSDTVTERALLARGIHNDVDDLEAVRRALGLDAVNLIGHSYMGLTAVLYAMKHPACVARIVQLAPTPPSHVTRYTPDLTANDELLRETVARLAELQKERAAYGPADFSRKVWSVLRVLYVADPADAAKVRWDRADLPNERAFMRYWMEDLVPSIKALSLTAEELAGVTCPVLTIHGRRDPGATDDRVDEWTRLLSNARLMIVDAAGHGPWFEAPEEVLGAIDAFLAGGWPAV